MTKRTKKGKDWFYLLQFDTKPVESPAIWKLDEARKKELQKVLEKGAGFSTGWFRSRFVLSMAFIGKEGREGPIRIAYQQEFGNGIRIVDSLVFDVLGCQDTSGKSCLVHKGMAPWDVDQFFKSILEETLQGIIYDVVNLREGMVEGFGWGIDEVLLELRRLEQRVREEFYQTYRLAYDRVAERIGPAESFRIPRYPRGSKEWRPPE